MCVTIKKDVEEFAKEAKKVSTLLAAALASINASASKIPDREIKIQCLQLACNALGVYGTASYSIDGKSSKPGCKEVLDEAQKFYDWVSGE